MWNHNIDAAPRGKTIIVNRIIKGKQREIEETRREYILAVHADGLVAQSYWITPRYTQSGALLEGNRWSGFNLGSEPIAWAPWPTYEIHESPSNNDKACSKAVPQDKPSPAGIGSELPAGREGRHEGEAASADLPTNSKTDAAISRPGIASPGRPEIENRSDEEASESEASGGVQDECAIHPAAPFILEDCGSGA